MRIQDQLREEVIKLKGRYCMYCGKGKLYRRALQIDHIIPPKHGRLGSQGIKNFAIACSQCNRRKGSKTAYEYAGVRLEAIEKEARILRAVRQSQKK